MKKRRLVLVALLILTALYPFVVNWAVQAFESWNTAALERYPEDLRPYVDHDFFVSSHWGSFVIVLGAFIAVSWLLLAVWRK
jgi:hypothetical protein